MGQPESAAESFSRLLTTIQRLRAPGGCPWDIEQTPHTLRGSLIEESYECIEAIEEGDAAHIKEELGDVLLLVLMLAYMHEQDGHFSVAAVLDGLNQKLIRRHPHVFSDTNVKDSQEVLENWTKIKTEVEGRARKDSILDEVSRALPALERSWKMQKKAAKIGFDWPSPEGIWAKIDEELREVHEAITAHTAPHSGADTHAALEGECGDVLFSVVNLCRFFEINPSLALQRTNNKFEKRFKFLEKEIKNHPPAAPNGKHPLETLDALWEAAKTQVG